MRNQGLIEKNNLGVGNVNQITSGEILDYSVSNRLRTCRLKLSINLLFRWFSLQYMLFVFVLIFFLLYLIWVSKFEAPKNRLPLSILVFNQTVTILATCIR